MEERYQAILEHNQSLLEGLSGALQSRLHEWAHPGTSVALRWHYDPAKSVAVNEPIVRAAIGEGSFRGELARLGHGLQRSFLVALLQELSSSEDGTGPTLILGIEEPELYQHPPQARHLAGVLERLARHDAQVVVTTHSPYFVSARGFECVRMVQKVPSTGASRVSQYTFAELSEAIALALQAKPQPPTALMAAVEQILQPSQVELFFTSTPVLVEGPEDVAFIATYLHLMDKWDDFRKLGCHFVVCNGKTNMSRPLGIAIGLRVPAFVVFDGDLDDKKNADRHMRDNMCLLRLCGHTEYGTADGKDIWWQNGVMWHTKIAKGVLADLGKESWEAAEATAKAMEGLTDGVGRKNALLIAATLEILWDDGKKSDRLTNLCSSLLAYARNPWKDVPHEMSPVVLT